MHKIKVAIVDDHQIIIDGLISLLQKFPHIQIVHSTNSAEKMLQLLHRQQPNVLLTDVMMPGMSGKELAKAVKQLYPEIRILALSMSGQGHTVSEMINDADIAGYLLKQTNATELAQAIQKVYDGGIYFQEDVLHELQQHSEKKTRSASIKITRREQQLIVLIEKDLSNKEIATALNISLHTVETHRKNIFRKTGATNALSLVKWAYENKILNK